MVFQDGDAYLKEHVGTVVDNLIAAKAMPVTILLLLNPGVNDDGTSNRSVEYDTLSDRYATFLEKEAIPPGREGLQDPRPTRPTARSAGRARGASARSPPPGTGPTSSAASARRSAASPTSAAATPTPT